MRTLTIYLIREEFDSPASILEKFPAEHLVSIGGVGVGTLYIQNVPEKRPAWSTLFSGVLDQRIFDPVKTSSALYVTTIAGRLFAIAFGQGRHLMKPDAFEDRFGLMVAVNLLESDKLRSVDKRTFDTVDQNIRAQVSQSSSASEFGIDIEKDLIRGLTGTLEDPLLGSRITGADALTVTADFDLNTLPHFLERYLEAYSSTAYKENFSWIDQIHQVRDKSPTRLKLDKMLLAKLREAIAEGRTATGIWLAIPDVVDYAGIHRFKFTGGRETHNDIHLPGFIQSLAHGDEVTIETLKKKQAYAVNEDNIPVGDKWPIYKCIHFETDLEGSTYLLATGKWFQVRSDFVKEVDDFYQSVPLVDLRWPEYAHETEGAYNASIAEASDGALALMDAIPIRVGGVRDKVEFCDLYRDDMTMLHVKRYGGSSLLGHLFNQALVSGELLRSEPTFQEKINEHLPQTHCINVEDRIPRVIANFKIVFAIISEHQGSDLNIPFFAKVAFKTVCQKLASIGFLERFRAKITVDEVFSRTGRVIQRRQRATRAR